jgi:hypothetical protein
MLRRLVIAMVLGGCAWACPSTVPSGVTVCYYIDYTNSGGTASDSNAGTSEALPWLHAPGMHNVSGTPAGHTPTAGEGWIFKGGVTVDFNAFPMNVPWGCATGSSSCSSGATPDYMGYDSTWYSGGSWTRPIFNGGGNSGYDTHNQSLITDISHRASFVIIDNIEITGIYFGSSCSSSGPYACGAISQYGYSGSDVGWEIKHVYAHGITHCTYSAGCIDPGNQASVLWADQDHTGATSIHDNVIDNTDGSYDCCNALAAWVEYNNVISGFTNSEFGEIGLFHDNVIQNMTLTFAIPGVVHGNCVHLFGSSAVTEIVYNNSIRCFQGFGPWVATNNYTGSIRTIFITPTSNNTQGYTYEMTTVGTTGSSQPNWNLTCPNQGNTCSDGTAVWTNTAQYTSADEMFLIEETGGAVVYAFNNGMMQDGHGSGFEIKNNNTNFLFQNTQEGGSDPNPNSTCIKLYATGVATVTADNNACFTSNSNAPTVCTENSVGNACNNGLSGFTGTYSAFPQVAKSCSSGSQSTYGGTQICAPIGTTNGLGNLNIGQSFPFDPFNPAAANLLGTAPSLVSLCALIPNPAAATACLSDSSLGVAYNTTNHTVSWPARQPIPHPSTNWRIGALEAPPAATNSYITVAVDSPTNGGNNFAAWQSLVATPNSLLTYQMPQLNVGDTTGSNTYAFDQETGTGACSPVYNWTANDALIAAYPTIHKIQPAAEGNSSTATAACAYSQAQANASALTYAPGYEWLPGEYISFNGNFWQIQTGCLNTGGSTYTNTCLGGTTLASFCMITNTGNTGASCADTGSLFNWINVGTNAPPLDGWCGNGHTCGGLNSTTTGIIVNINNYVSQGATLAQLYDSQPIPWELPYRNWAFPVMAAYIAHYNSSPYLSNLAAFRLGWPMGGEIGGIGGTIWPYSNYSIGGYNQLEGQYMSMVAKLYQFLAAQNPAMMIFGDINSAAFGGGQSYAASYADQEAILANANGFAAIGNQDYNDQDILNITGATGYTTKCTYPPTAASGCSQGDWFYNFYEFPNMLHQLQFLTGSTALSCTPNTIGGGGGTAVEGGLAAVVSGTNCTAGSVGLLPFLVGLRTAGVGGIVETVNDYESVFTATAGGSSQTSPASDVLLTLYSNYTSTLGAISAYFTEQPAYQQAWAQFLGQTFYTVTVTVEGGTSGTVINDSQGAIVNCSATGGTCSGSVLSGAVDTLTPTGSNFNSYSGACTGTTCSVTISGNTAITAYFGCGVGTYPCNPTGYTGTTIVAPNSSLPYPLGTYTKNGAIVYDTSYLAHGETFNHLSRIVRCTDQNFAPSSGSPLGGFSAGLGGAGSGILWNTNSTLIHVIGSSGSGEIALFNPSTLVCNPAITADKNQTHPGSSSNLAAFGVGEFSQSNPSIWWAGGVVGSDVLSNMVVTPYTINTSTGYYSVGSTAEDSTFGMPVGANVAEWQASQSYAAGVYVKHTMISSEYKTWAATTAFSQGDIIYPGAPNCGFMVQTAGTTGSGTQPTWPLVSGACGGNPTTVTDGTVKWRSMVSAPPAFIFQLTSAGGTSGSTTPAFVPGGLGGHPDLGSTVSDSSLTWTNVGVNVITPNGLWSSGRRVSPDGTKFEGSFSINTYGAVPGSYVATDAGVNYANANGDQGTGDTTVVYDATANIYHLMNTMTLIQTDFVCTGGTGYNCLGGSFVQTPQGTATGQACPFLLHDSAASAGVNTAILSVSSNLIGPSCPAAAAVAWRALQPFTAATQLLAQYAQVSHTAFGFSNIIGIAQSASTYGYTSGVYSNLVNLASPQIFPATTWQAYPCDAGSWYPGDPNQPCQVQFDTHLSWAYNPNQLDTSPVCGTFFDVTASTANSMNPGAAYEGEVACFSTIPTATSAGSSELGTQWRFGHTASFQTNQNFNLWFNIGQESQDGRFYAFGTENLGQFGSTTGSAPTLPISNPSVLCLGGFPWLASTVYTAGTVITPIASLNGGGEPYHTYQALTTGTSGSGVPAWSTTTTGGTIVDNGVTWEDLGVGNCRGDVVIMELGQPSTVSPGPYPPAFLSYVIDYNSAQGAAK